MRLGLGILIILVVGSISGMYPAILLHEQAHSQVFAMTGYENITIEYEGGKLVTRADPTNYTDYIAMRNFQMKTEIEGYHTMGFIINLWIMFTIGIFVIVLLYEYGT